MVAMKGSNSSNHKSEGDAAATIDWEMRPGGMLVQKREDEEDGGRVIGPDGGGKGPIIKIKVCHDTSRHELSVPAQSTFGELKRVLAQVTGLEPQEQRLLFRGKEKDNDEFLHMAGVKDTSKIVLLEDPASKERKLEKMTRDQGISEACESVVIVRSEVDELAEKAVALESAVNGGAKVAEKEIIVLTELLMVQLLKLDGIEAKGEAKVQRRIEVNVEDAIRVFPMANTAKYPCPWFPLVCRIQNLLDRLDALKAKNANPFGCSSNAVSVRTQWEQFH